MVERFDIVVVGGGPAGSAAAMTAARAGMRCGLLDKAEFPREKLCGGLITGRSERAIARIFDAALDPDVFLACDTMRFKASSRVLSEFRDAPRVHLTMRRDFDTWLRAKAVKAGAIPITGELRDVDEKHSVIHLRDGRTLAFGVLIGADGVNSALARSLFGRAFDPATIGFGLEIEAPNSPKDTPPVVEVDFDAAAWGYGWSFPKHHSTTIGVGGISARNADMKARMTAYRALQGADAASARVKGQYLPFGDFRRQPGRGAVVLAGDAAGLVDPITGEGIALAMESGELAARSAVAAMAKQQPAQAYSIYRHAIRPLHRELAEARFWRRLIFSASLRPAFLSAFAGSRLPPRFLDLLAGNTSYRDLRLDLLRRVPKSLWRAGVTRWRRV